MLKPIKFLLYLFTINLVILVFIPSVRAVESVCPGGSSPDSNVLMCDDFEDGTWLDNWSASPGYSPEYSEAVRCDSSNFGYQDKCAAYSGILHFDGAWGYDNHFAGRGLPAATEYDELYLRMYIYFSSPYSWGNTDDKGIYFANYDKAIENIKLEYSSWGTGKPTIASYALSGERRYQNQGNDITLQPGKWYLIEMYVKLNTPGVSDGIVKVWIDDASNTVNSQTLKIYYNNLLIRNSSRGYNRLMLTLYNQRCDLGSACPSTISQWVKWDNIVVSKNPIGPMGGGGGNTPPPSSSSGGNSGGGSGGGGGCGFVKDNNGKGQGAKGEGLSLIIMLIIALTGIALARRTENITATKEGALVMNTRKNSLIKIAAISFLLTIFWSASAFAQPNITSFSGSLTDGSTITINGNSFGVNGPNIVVFDDFESGTNGSNIKTGAGSATMGKWDSVGGATNNSIPVYDNTYSVSGSKAMKSDYTKDYSSNAQVQNINTKDAFVSYWFYLPTTSEFPFGDGAGNWKVAWLYGIDTTQDDQVIAVGLPGSTFPVPQPFSTWAISCNGCYNGKTNWFSFNMYKGAWYRVSTWIHATNDTTGREQFSVLSKDKGIANTLLVDWTGRIFNNASSQFLNFSMSAYAKQTAAAESAPRYDDVYLATGPNARARIEIGDAATYTTCKNLTIATVTSWSDTSITATVRQGSFSNLNNAYLYVIDANGNVNTNGYLLSDGGSGGNTPPPSSGSGGDSGGGSGGGGCGFVKDSKRESKGQGGSVTDIGLMIMLIIALITIAIAKMVFKRRTATSKAGSNLLNFKSRLILLTLLFLFTVYTPANATMYFYYDAENETVGNGVPRDPNGVDICTQGCSSFGFSDATVQSAGGAPQGSKYFQWVTVDNQPSVYTEVVNHTTFPISLSLGTTYYLAYFFNFTRINALDIWHETGQSADKGVELDGSGIRWIISRGNWSCIADTQDHYYTVWTGNPTYHLNPSPIPNCVDNIFGGNQNGYSASNPIQLQYERWYSAVMAVKIASNNTGSVAFWIDGVKIGEYNNIITAANSSPTINFIGMGGTIAQSALDAPAHYRKFDAMMLTDNWQDIVNGGYLSSNTPPSSDGGNTPPPPSGSSGDSSASGGSGCGFVKDDGKGQMAKGEGVSMMILLIITMAGIALFKRRLSNVRRHEKERADI